MITPIEPSAPDAGLGQVLAHLLAPELFPREVARAVAATLPAYGPDEAPATDRLLWRAACALDSTGARDAAHRVLSATTSWQAWSGRIDLSAVSRDAGSLLESGLLRAASSPVLGGGLCVHLDLGKLPPEKPALEIIYLPLLHRLVDACAPLWRPFRGGGALLVSGLRAHAPTGGVRRRRLLTPCAADWMMDGLRDRLAWLADREQWPQPPWLVRADP